MQNRSLLAATIVLLCLQFLLTQPSFAQESTPKAEIGVQFTSLSVSDPLFAFTPERKFSYPGIGGRFTYNITDNFAFETEANVFLRKNNRGFSRFVGGFPVQALFGVKAGKRLKRIGVFGKVRPGFVSFSKTISTGLGPSFESYSRRTHLATDVGGVFEFYPSRRIVTRFDLGDTIIRYGDELIPGASIPIKGMLSIIFSLAWA